MPMRFFSGVIIAALMLQFSFVLSAHAAVRDWQKSVSIIPDSSTVYSSDAFRQSVDRAKAAGANYVNLIIPYYQSNPGSTDIGAGWNTPTDASLVQGIQYAHSIGLKVSLAIYLENYSGDWRAYINPNDRNTWYQRYGDVLMKYGQIAQAQHAEQFVLGAELISMASQYMHSDNEARWEAMIARVRGVYGGQLTYSANRGQPDPFGAEVTHTEFWDKLDIIGLSGYYSLGSDGSAAAMKSAWNDINGYDVRPLYQKWNKPILFSEIGYRSVSGAHQQPWDSGMGGPYDPQEQVNDYEALFGYWNDYSYVQGAMLWWWKPNPNAGGSGDTDYTPQNKPAESTLKSWWLSGTTPAPSGPVAFTAAGSAPGTAAAGQSVTLTAQVTETAGSSAGNNIDLEVYNGSSRVFQKVFGNESFAANQTKTYTAAWTPASAGTYTFKIGVFSGDWSKTYTWNNSAATITVSAGSTGGGTAAPPPTGSYTTEVWWPTDGSHVSGVQPFKAMLQGLDVSQYSMFWSVDGGGLVTMPTNTADYPHKEALVDLSGWSWKGAGPYTITFTSRNGSGATISTKSIQLFTR
jgi:hypothetical protein